MSLHRKHRTEKGAVLVIFAVALVVLLTLVGLAVDAGNLYRARLALQNSADAAALAGLAYTTSKGKFGLEREIRESKNVAPNAPLSDQDIAEYLNSKVTHVAHAVMARAGFPHSSDSNPVLLQGEYVRPPVEVDSEVAASYRVTLSRRIDLHLMNLLPGLNTGDFRELSAGATVQRKIARISLFLDSSDSMNCPAAGDCACMRAPGAGPCTGARKSDDLLDAVKVFAKMFDPARDKLYLIPFNIRGTAFSMAEYKNLVGAFPPMDQLTEADIDQIFDLLRTDPAARPQGSTNICDALMRARKALENDELLGVEGNSLVIFTDGAPTAGRFLFSDAKGSLPQWSPTGWGTHDYSVYTVEWRQDNDPLTPRYGPSILLQSDLLIPGHISPEPPACFPWQVVI